jgi:DnaJ-class molecular chaperone
MKITPGLGDKVSDYGNRQDTCSHCCGTRAVEGKMCPVCDGSGIEPEYEDDEYRD